MELKRGIVMYRESMIKSCLESGITRCINILTELCLLGLIVSLCINPVISAAADNASINMTNKSTSNVENELITGNISIPPGASIYPNETPLLRPTPLEPSGRPIPSPGTSIMVISALMVSLSIALLMLRKERR
ncbi:hypothetical protein [Methanocella conradii]|uniref:hypothetical protein n=1 Tax=Methanocella conradii TaxID=1175444 RepID=UPI0024B369BA|nr:hypothetical protein [Methanocella conradii]MDI6896939.1 hypothetical protein [Methanocella conradii]